MKVFVVFGSASDEPVSGPLVQALSGVCQPEFEVISAHRDLEKLHQKITTWKGDAIVAGAGLAAALPGVVAAMTKLPVFGVPVPSQFSGLDALCSIGQMPPGVPVITCGPASTAPIVSFLSAHDAQAKTDWSEVRFVSASNDPELAAEVEKARAAAADKGVKVTLSPEEDARAFNIYVVESAKDVRPGAYGLHVPFLRKSETVQPGAYLPVMEWMNKGGLWVGVNNTRNALHAALRLRRAA